MASVWSIQVIVAASKQWYYTSPDPPTPQYIVIELINCQVSISQSVVISVISLWNIVIIKCYLQYQGL